MHKTRSPILLAPRPTQQRTLGHDIEVEQEVIIIIVLGASTSPTLV